MIATRERLRLPSSVCFRVTRFCNARCGFCLAPVDGSHPDAEVLKARVDWVLARGVRAVHFCGGEPTIHPALPELLEHVRARGARAKLTTNGISVGAALVDALAAQRTPVKVSLHGDRAHHDAVVGRAAYDRAAETVRRLLAARVPTSVQTTVTAGAERQLEPVVDFCLAHRVRRLSVLPFLARGDGLARRGEYELSPRARDALRGEVRRRRGELLGRGLELRWLDFRRRPLPVVEADGRVVLEGATEAQDRTLATLD